METTFDVIEEPISGARCAAWILVAAGIGMYAAVIGFAAAFRWALDNVQVLIR